jgi:small subunit ribosomal protein S20
LPAKGPAGKRHRQNITHRLRNKEYKSNVRTAKNRFLDSVKAEDKDAALQNFKTFEKVVDTAQGHGVFHKNSAARKKSRMHKLLNTMK